MQINTCNPPKIMVLIHTAAIRAIQEDFPAHSLGLAIYESRFYEYWTQNDIDIAHTTFYQAYQDQVYRLSSLHYHDQKRSDQKIMQKHGMLNGRFWFFIRPRNNNISQPLTL